MPEVQAIHHRADTAVDAGPRGHEGLGCGEAYAVRGMPGIARPVVRCASHHRQFMHGPDPDSALELVPEPG
jgi:hypothetical protein